jgi:hypothetical protein
MEFKHPAEGQEQKKLLTAEEVPHSRNILLNKQTNKHLSTKETITHVKIIDFVHYFQ